jgi:type I restriction enzyme R subunit
LIYRESVGSVLKARERKEFVEATSSTVRLLPAKKLLELAVYPIEIVCRNFSNGDSTKASIKARLMVIFKRAHRKFSYPPEQAKFSI